MNSPFSSTMSPNESSRQSSPELFTENLITDIWDQSSSFSFSPKPSHSSAISISKKNDQNSFENSFQSSFDNSFQGSFQSSFQNSFDGYETQSVETPQNLYYAMSSSSFTSQMNQPNLHGNSYDSKTLKYCTKPCIFYMQNGFCKKGDHCTFSHDLNVFNSTQTSAKTFISIDKLYRTKPCKYFFETGVCRKGEHCNFSHDLSLKERYLKGEFE